MIFELMVYVMFGNEVCFVVYVCIEVVDDGSFVLE